MTEQGTALGAWLERTGVTMKDLAAAAGDMRYATVHEVVHGKHVPGVEIAKRLAAATVKLAQDRGLEGPPVTPAEILGVADWEAA